MSWDLMSYLSRALSWAGGTDVGRNAHVDGGASAGAGAITGAPTGASEILGGMVGGFGGPTAWRGAGFGGQLNGGISNRSGDYARANAGLGFGAGYSPLSSTVDGTTYNGYSGAVGGVAPVGMSAGTPDNNVSASSNLYRGAGGSAYSYSNGADHGYGARGNYTPFGAADTNFDVNTRYGSYNAHADNAYLNRLSGGAQFGTDGNRYHGELSGGMSSGIDGASTRLSTPIGNMTSSAGSINYGVSGGVGGGYDRTTGVFDANARFSDGLGARDLRAGIHGPGGGGVDAGVGSVFYGNRGDANAQFDPSTGRLTGNANASFGGVDVRNSSVNADFGRYGNANATLGEFSNDNRINAQFVADRNHLGVSGDADGMGMRFNNFAAQGQIGSGPNAVHANAGFDSLGNNNSIHGANAMIDTSDPRNPTLRAGFRDLSFGDWSGSNLHADVNGPYGANMHASVHDFTTGFQANDFNATLNNNGLNANLGHGQYSDFDIHDAHLHSGIGPVSSDLQVGRAASDRVMVDNAHVDASLDPRRGVHANVGSAQYDEVYLQGISADQHLGDVYNSHIGLDEGTFNHAAARNIHAGADLNHGIDAGLQDGHYSFLGGRGIDVQQSALGNNLGWGVHAGSASLGGVDVGNAQFNSTLRNTNANVDNLDAYGWRARDQRVNAHIGALGANVGADSVNLADLHVGNAQLHSSNFGTTGNASVDQARYNMVDIHGGNAGLSWGGRQMLGVGTDVNAGAGVDHAQGNWDLLHGNAGGSFQNANIGGQLSNTHLNLFGHNLSIPDMGAHLNASGGANVDLRHGAASANLSLAGSDVNFAGQHFVMPSWAQASGGVDLSHGAVNANLGGRNGVGADVNLSQGQFDINAFGHHVDVAQGVRDVGSGISSAASTVGHGISSAASTVGSGISSAAHSVGSLVSHLW
jgi:hypothetical protein